MGILRRYSSILANPTAYRIWQSPFVKAKFEPVFRHNQMNQVRRVLDVGCGPGTNAGLFTEIDYLGLDLNPQYVEQAKRRFGNRFEVADVCTYEADENNRFDFVLMNSLLHHVDTENVHRILDQLKRQIAEDGHIHILDLVLPEKTSISRTLAEADRGDYPRPLDTWKEIFTTHYDAVEFEPYELKCAGITLWNMVYFKGSPK